MRLSLQLFITLLIASALLVALMFAITSFSFSRGFLAYINDAEKSRLSSLTSNLAAIYEQDPNWDWIEKGSDRWRQVLVASNLSSRPPPTRGPKRGGKTGTEQQGGSEVDNGSSAKLDKAQRNGRDNSRTGSRDRTILPRLMFKDAQNNILIGRLSDAKSTQTQWLPVLVEEKAVGYVGYKTRTELTEQFDQAFEGQQRRSFALAALGMIVLSGLLSIPLASRIVKPILKLNKAVGEISQGNYQQRVSMDRNDEIGDLASNVNKLSFTLERNLAARQRWIAEISHELRTPVAVLQGEVEALQDGVREFNEGSAQSIHAEVIRLSRLIDDLHQLSMSDIGALDYKMTAVSIKALIEQLLSTNATSLKQANLNWEVQYSKNGIAVNDDERFMLQADEQRMGQLLNNLLQNSTRYTSEGGTVFINVDQQPNAVLLTWADTAPGVSDAELPKLLDPLYRTEQSRSRKNGGAGLGLSIVKNVVEAHGGQIELTHAPSGGLQVNISIPC